MTLSLSHRDFALFEKLIYSVLQAQFPWGKHTNQLADLAEAWMHFSFSVFQLRTRS